jgi:hypothetical protein
MNFKSLFAVFSVMAMVGCAAQSSDDNNNVEDQGDGSEEVKGATKYHFAPGGAEVFWKPGCGVRMPDGNACEMGLFITYTRHYIDLQVTESLSFDKKSNTLTVKLDTWSYGKFHPMVAVGPQTEPLEIPSSMHLGMGSRFDVRVVDWKNNELWTGTINEIPAP